MTDGVRKVLFRLSCRIPTSMEEIDRLLHSCQYLSKQVEKVKQSHKHSELCSDVFFLHVYIASQLCFAHNNTYSLHSCILHISSLSMKMGFATSLMVI